MIDWYCLIVQELLSFRLYKARMEENGLERVHLYISPFMFPHYNIALHICNYIYYNYIRCIVPANMILYT